MSDANPNILRLAPLGTAFRDRDGDTWTRQKTGATIAFTTTNPEERPLHWPTVDLDEAWEQHGPMREVKSA